MRARLVFVCFVSCFWWWWCLGVAGRATEWSYNTTFCTVAVHGCSCLACCEYGREGQVESKLRCRSRQQVPSLSEGGNNLNFCLVCMHF